MVKNIIWDLDGTLTDSSEGITKCVKLALDHFKIEAGGPETLRHFIGPPLSETFETYGMSKEQSWEAVQVFRSRYNTVGKFENRPYDGIKELLGTLQQEGYALYVGTSKPELTAKQILDKFELSSYFRIICGATMDGTRDKKSQVLSYLLEQMEDRAGVVMIGDTHFDVTGAAEHGIPTIGVTWGFGTRESMEEAGAVCIVDTMDELHEVIRKWDARG